LVDNSKIKKQVKAVYDSVKGGYKPKFTYIQLTIDPHNVDVNVHPTKNKVHLLNEDMIVKSLSQVLFDSLNGAITKEVKQSAPRTKTKGKKQAIPENQTIKHYFKPIISHITSEEVMSNMNGSGSSVVEALPQSPADINLVNIGMK
jgi:DNA mismatch repair ATPase MutL